MLEFCGQERCMIDSNGRVKLSTIWLENYKKYTDRDVILHCLPEGSIVIYPPKFWQEMRGSENNKSVQAAQSLVFRRNLRRFGAMSVGIAISNQGRITIPPAYRTFAELTINTEIMLVGCEIGLEIWNMERWAQETQLIQKHITHKGEYEMNADLIKDDQV